MVKGKTAVDSKSNIILDNRIDISDSFNLNKYLKTSNLKKHYNLLLKIQENIQVILTPMDYSQYMVTKAVKFFKSSEVQKFYIMMFKILFIVNIKKLLEEKLKEKLFSMELYKVEW